MELITATQPIVEAAAFGGGGYLFSLAGRLLNKKMDYGHNERLAAMQHQSRMILKKIEDTQDARKYKFKFARRVIAGSLFLLTPLYLFIVNMVDHNIAIPTKVSKSYLWGLVSWSENSVQTFSAFYHDPHAWMCLSLMIAGFYFGQKTD